MSPRKPGAFFLVVKRGDDAIGMFAWLVWARNGTHAGRIAEGHYSTGAAPLAAVELSAETAFALLAEGTPALADEEFPLPT